MKKIFTLLIAMVVTLSLMAITPAELGKQDPTGHATKMVEKKMAAAIRNKITPILCIGETESERSFGETTDVIRDQLLGGLRDVSEEDIDAISTIIKEYKSK
jgi:hypothetical protein